MSDGESEDYVEEEGRNMTDRLCDLTFALSRMFEIVGGHFIRPVKPDVFYPPQGDEGEGENTNKG